MRNTVSDPSRGLGSFLPKANLSLQEHHKPVSGPSRGLGSFLTTFSEEDKAKASFRPLSRLGWVPTFELYSREDGDDPMFPAPLEAWVVSYNERKVTI